MIRKFFFLWAALLSFLIAAQALAANPGKAVITGVAATGKTTATVAFTAPASNGGSPIAGYFAYSSPEGGLGTLQGGSGTITVNGLTAGTAYTFKVKTMNLNGGSSWSDASASVTTSPGAPGAPTIGAVTVTGATTATVAFTAPGSNGGSAITQYKATSNPGGITATVSQPGSGTIPITGLSANTAYTFTVAATNALGTSVSSNASTSVTTMYQVGSTGPGGGKVFYVSTTGFKCGPTLTSTCNYLEVAPPLAGAVAWCKASQSSNNTVSSPGAWGTDIGVGYYNSLKIVSYGCGTGAAGVARAYTGGGLSDWHLPSKDEQWQITRYNITTRGDLGLSGAYYWGSSASTFNSIDAWAIKNNTVMTILKETESSVLPIRAF